MRIARAWSRLAPAHNTVIIVISKKGLSKTRLLKPAPLGVAGSLGEKTYQNVGELFWTRKPSTGGGNALKDL